MCFLTCYVSIHVIAMVQFITFLQVSFSGLFLIIYGYILQFSGTVREGIHGTS